MRWTSKNLSIIFFILAGIVALFLFSPSWASGDDCRNPHEQCGHNDGKDGEDGKDGRNGKDGIDGIDGIDGVDGVDGEDGRDGSNGIDGKDGRDGISGINGINGLNGEVPNEWITNVTKLYNESREVAAAQAAMQVHLPQHQTSRLTFSGSHVNGKSGVGVGYAYMLDNDRRSALTLSVGQSGDETAVRGSFGFEFGGDRRIEIPSFAPAPVAAPPPEPAPVPTGMIQLTASEYDGLMLMADNSEQMEDYAEQAEYRYAQQQSLIEDLQRGHDDDDAEIERLKQEAAALRASDKEGAARRESVRQRILTKRKKDGTESDS